MNHYRTLIVEDEIIIADTIKRYLQKQGHEVVGTAISYEEATELYQKEKPDIALLDIRLSGSKTGIDVANFIQEQQHTSPFIFLSSQLDSRSIDDAKRTLPSGYLTKPIQKTSLYTTMEMAMYAYEVKKRKATTVKFNDGASCHHVAMNDILYLEVDHVYVNIVLRNNKTILQRASMKEILSQLPANKFIQTHRTYAVNLTQVTNWNNNEVYVQDQRIP
ncbi:MAG: response regulator, partial [Bacteroidota bacterium]